MIVLAMASAARAAQNATAFTNRLEPAGTAIRQPRNRSGATTSATSGPPCSAYPTRIEIGRRFT
jgi:hypothetical protein